MSKETTFKLKRGVSGGAFPTSLTHGELAINTTDQRLFVGSVTGGPLPFNRVFLGSEQPSNPINGDYWYTGTVNKIYYEGIWETAGGTAGGTGSFDPTNQLVYFRGLSGEGGSTFAGGVAISTGGLKINSGGLSVTGGSTLTGGISVYGGLNVRSGNISGLPIASSSITGVASFTNDFVVSLDGSVSLTGNYVKSINGSTGAVSFAVPVASSSATGVASFSNEFLVSAAGAVSLTSNYVTSFNGSTGAVSFAVPVASSSVTGVASFGNEFVVSAAGAVSLTSNYVTSFNGLTGSISFVVPVASSSVTGVASFSNDFVVSLEGSVSLTGNYVKSVNGLTGAVVSVATTGSNTFTDLQTMNAGLSSNHLYVSNGATFANGLVVSSGTISGTLSTNSQPNITSVGSLSSLTVSGIINANSGVTSNHLYVSNGATFANGLSIIAGGLKVTGSTLLDGSPGTGLVVTGSSFYNSGLQIIRGSLSVTGGIKVNTGGIYLTGGLTAYGSVNILNSFTVTGEGATAFFRALSVGGITSAYTLAIRGFTSDFIYCPNPILLYPLGDIGFINQAAAVQIDNDVARFYRWGADNLLSREYLYGYSSVLGSTVGTQLQYYRQPPSGLPVAKKLTKVVDVVISVNTLGEIGLLADKSLTSWGNVLKLPGFETSSPVGNFIDIASGLSGTVPHNGNYSNEIAGWWLGLMENGRLTGQAWPASSRNTASPASLAGSMSNPIFSTMPPSLRWDAASGITAKAILSTDDAYCYAILADNSLTAWGATCFMLGGSGSNTPGTLGGPPSTTGGILANFQPGSATFSGFASRKATRTLAFVIKSDGNIQCFGYTGTSTITDPLRTSNGVVDYRSVFCTPRTNDDQIIKIDHVSDRITSSNSIYTRVLSGVQPGFFCGEVYRTYKTTGDRRVFIGLTKSGNLTAGIHYVNETTSLGYEAQPVDLWWPTYAASGVTFSNVVCGPRLVLGQKADGSLIAYGLTSPTSGFSVNLEWNQQTSVPESFMRGSQSYVRFGGAVSISSVPQGTSDPYTDLQLLDIRGSAVASGFIVASDAELKSEIANKPTGTKEVSQWKKDLLDNLQPKEFYYLGDPTNKKTIGYLAGDAESANSKYVAHINPASTIIDAPPRLTGSSIEPYSGINLSTLMVGTIESLRELDTEMSRIWLTESLPYPSKVKNSDLWYYSGENRLYIRKNDVWIQVN